MKRSSSADRAAPRPQDLLPFNNSLPARPKLLRTASLGREVRCGCQFFGTDSLLPEKAALIQLGRPKARSALSSPKLSRAHQPTSAGTMRRRAIITSARSVSSVGDHEYEPVSVQQQPPTVRISGPYDRYEPELGTAPREGSNSSTESRERKERKFLRTPLDDDVRAPPQDGEGSEEEAMGAEEREEEEDERAVAAPSPGTTTGSRTDLELNTSQVDSSALEDLPLSREGRRQQRLRQSAEGRGPGAAARSLQRIRSEAGKLRTKLRSIKRPNINLPERPRFSMPERPKFNFPERPKFNLPERPKFNFPERPKFNFPERPKFNLPERPKFNMPQRPKFNMPERPKFNMPERPKFNFPSFSMPRPRRPLRERQDGGSLSSEQDVHMDTPAPSTPGKRNYFDFRTYPRIFDRKSRQHVRELNISAPVRHITPPAVSYDDDDIDMDEEEEEEPPRRPPPRRRSSEENSRWVGRFTELEYVDSENVRPQARLKNGAPAPFDDEDEDEEMRALARELHGDTEEEHSESLSGFRDKDFGYAVSLGPMRPPPPSQPKMVEPDEEEMSLQESEHDAAHSSGSSSDRRRAGVLEEIDSDEFFLREKGLSQEDVDVGRYLSSEIREAFRPAPDAAVLLMENATLNEAELARSYRGTPERATAPSNNKTRPPRRTRTIKQRSSAVVAATAPEPVSPQYFNTFPPNKPTRERRRVLRQQRKDQAATLGRPAPPLPPKRKKTTRSEAVLDTQSQWSEDAVEQEWINTVEANIVQDMKEHLKAADEHEYIIPAAPAAPRRGRRTSRHTPDEDPGYATVTKAPTQVEIEIVGRPCTPPPRRVKTLPRPPFPSIRRRRNNRPLSGSNQHFFTVPHRRGPPTRPTRNYATLGPARPPRKQRRSSIGESDVRDLQSAPVIQKMKERPLPPPPRPPRRERGLESQTDLADELEAEIKELAQEAPIAACEEIDMKPPVVATTEQQAQAEESGEKQETPEQEEHVVQHVIQLSSELVHTQREIVPEAVIYPSAPSESSVQEASMETSPSEASVLQTKTETSEAIEKLEPVMIQPELEVISSEQILESQVQEQTPAVTEDITRVAEQKQEEAVVEEIHHPQQASVVEEIQQQQTVQAVEEIHKPVTAEIQEAPKLTEEVQQQQVTRMVDEIIQQAASTVEAACAVEETMLVEEVSVSCQTDPLPDDELIGDELLMAESIEETRQEPTRQVASHQEAPREVQPPAPVLELPAPVPAQVVVPSILELSPAATALLEALNSGQLKLELLDVAKLNVNELQAQRLLVSDIESLALNVNDVQSRGGTLVLSSLDAPLGSLADALMTAAQQLVPPPQPAPAPQHIYMSSASTSTDLSITQYSQPSTSQSVTATSVQQSYSEPSSESSTSQTLVSEPVTSQSESSEQASSSLSTLPRSRQASPFPSSPVFTTEQVVALQAAALSNASRERDPSPQPPPLPPRRPSGFDQWQPPVMHREVEPSITELGSRLCRACCTATLGALRRVVTYSERTLQDASEERTERSGLQVALCVVLVLVAGLIIVASMGGGAGAVHHHHWDFYMPQ